MSAPAPPAWPAGRQAPAQPTAKRGRRRTGLVLALVLALVAVLAGVGVGAFLLLRGGDEDAAGPAKAPVADPGFTPTAPPTGPTGGPAKVGQPVRYDNGLQITLTKLSVVKAKGDFRAEPGEPLLVADFRVANGTGADLRDPDFVVRARLGSKQYSAESVVDGAVEGDSLSYNTELVLRDAPDGSTFQVLPAGKIMRGRHLFELRARADSAKVSVEVTPAAGGGDLPPAAVFEGAAP
jgi:hypothetical protein